MEGLIPPAIAFAVLFGIVGLIVLYQKVSRNGHALREYELPKEIYEILFSCKNKGETVILLRSAKGQVLSCVQLGEGLELFSQEGNFLVPKKIKKSSTVPFMGMSCR